MLINGNKHQGINCCGRMSCRKFTGKPSSGRIASLGIYVLACERMLCAPARFTEGSQLVVISATFLWCARLVYTAAVSCRRVTGA
jgi:hypothetical protein